MQATRFMLGQESEWIQLVLQETWPLQAWEKYMPKECTFEEEKSQNNEVIEAFKKC